MEDVTFGDIFGEICWSRSRVGGLREGRIVATQWELQQVRPRHSVEPVARSVDEEDWQSLRNRWAIS
eukprot:1394509-Amphidinium_carterae.2